MIIAYSKHGKSGGVRYAISNKTAKVLVGDPKITEQLIKQNKNKLKYRSGIISFEEKNPDKKIVQDVIDNFIKSTFTGLEKDQYNILMVEHTNTDNYHIHFTIPRLELTTGKSFNPHWHKEDQKRLLKLQDYLNAKHGLSNPFEAKKAKTLQDIDFKALNRNKIKEEINSFVEKLIIERRVQNRDELIKYFTESGFDVVRQSKNFITIKIDDTRIRLKGIYYADTFTDIEATTRELRKAEQEHTADTPKQLEQLKQELDELIQRKAERNRERYKKEFEKGAGRDRRNNVGVSKNNKVAINSTPDSAYDRRSNGVLGREILKPQQNISPGGNRNTEQRRDKNTMERQDELGQQHEDDNDKKRRVDDGTGAEAYRRIRNRREARARAIRKIRQAREAVYRQNRAERNRIFEENRRERKNLHRELTENSSRQQKEFGAAAAAAEQLGRRAEENRGALRETKQRERGVIGAVRKFIERAGEFVDRTKEYISEVGLKINLLVLISQPKQPKPKQEQRQKRRGLRL